MRIFTINGTSVAESDNLALLASAPLPQHGYVWIACARPEFETMQAQIQAALNALCGIQLVDLHIADLLNQQLPSRYDYTSQYDLLVFRRLATGSAEADLTQKGLPPNRLPARGGPPILRRIDTSPVGFAVFDHLLLTVHPADCAVRDAYAARLLAASSASAQAPNGHGLPDSRSAGARGVPANPADMMLRIVNQIVDSYLELRRELTHQLDHWQSALLDPSRASATGAPCWTPGCRCTIWTKSAKTNARPCRTGLKPSRPGQTPTHR